MSQSRKGYAQTLIESEFLTECFTDLKATAFKSLIHAKESTEILAIHGDMQALVRLERYLKNRANQEREATR